MTHQPILLRYPHTLNYHNLDLPEIRRSFTEAFQRSNAHNYALAAMLKWHRMNYERYWRSDTETRPEKCILKTASWLDNLNRIST
jgi:hypothetical protein